MSDPALRLKVIGPYKGISGYDHHTREFVRGLTGLGVQIQLQELEGWSAPLPDDQRDTSFDRLAQPVAAETVLHFVMPHQFEPERGRRNVHYTMFEADRIPRAWVAAAFAADVVVVPTEACRQAWIESGAPPARMRVSPLGCTFPTDNRTRPAELSIDGRALSTYRTRLLNIAEPRPRKNQIGLLRAWMHATRRGDEAVLILKLTSYAPRVRAAFEADVRAMEAQEGRRLIDAAPVVVIDGRLSYDDLASLRAAATHYVSLSHGEGWDMPMMEAAAVGLELVAPRHTAYLAYLGADDAHWIPSFPAPATFPFQLGAEDEVFFRGLKWWEPDQAVAIRLLQDLIAGRAPPRPPPAERIRRDYTWENAARHLLTILQAT